MDGNALTYIIVVQPSHAAVVLAGAMATYTPVLDYTGPDSFTFKATDGIVESNIATVTITVTAVNDAPVAEGQAVTTPADTAKEITLVTTDVDGDVLTFTVTQPTHGAVVVAAAVATYTPTAGNFGPDSFTFKANDGTVDSNVATVTITVNQTTQFIFLPIIIR